MKDDKKIIFKLFSLSLIRKIGNLVLKNLSRNARLLNNLQRYIEFLPLGLRKILQTNNYFLTSRPVFLISYPKSGRTWLRTMIGKYLCELLNLSDKMVLNIHFLSKNAGISPIILSHDESDKYSYHYHPKTKQKYSNNKVIFLIRDVKDIIVSNYHHVRFRLKLFQGSISEFIQDDLYGIKTILNFYKIWYRNQNVPENFLLLKYEDLHKNGMKTLCKCLLFLGFLKIDDGILKKAIEFSSFKNMKKLEKNQFFSDKTLKPKDPNDNRTYKVRKGKVGGYKSSLSKEDEIIIDKAIEEIGYPFYE